MVVFPYIIHNSSSSTLFLKHKKQGVTGLTSNYMRFGLLVFLYSLPSWTTDKKYVNWTLQLASIHGHRAPLPFIKSVEVILCLEIHAAAHFP